MDIHRCCLPLPLAASILPSLFFGVCVCLCWLARQFACTWLDKFEIPNARHRHSRWMAAALIKSNEMSNARVKWIYLENDRVITLVWWQGRPEWMRTTREGKREKKAKSPEWVSPSYPLTINVTCFFNVDCKLAFFLSIYVKNVCIGAAWPPSSWLDFCMPNQQ